MKLTLQELNEMYYCLNKTLNSDVPNMANKELLSELIDKVSNEISMKVYEEEQIELQINEPRRQYDQWWEQNKERILAEDQLNHEMQFKSAYAKQGDY
jgi:DNA-binding protein H-NS